MAADVTLTERDFDVAVELVEQLHDAGREEEAQAVYRLIVQAERSGARRPVAEPGLQGSYGVRTDEREWDQSTVTRRRRAFERACGALPIGITRESWREAETDRLEFEAGER